MSMQILGQLAQLFLLYLDAQLVKVGMILC